MKKFFAALFAFALCLSAADFWQSKPFSEWSDKDLEKMMTNSPWARPFTVSMVAPGGPGDSGAPPPISEGGGRGGRGGGGGGGAPGGAALPSPGGLAPTVVARWQSALPIKQAFVRQKYAAEAAASSEAKQVLEHEESTYLIVLSGPLRAFLRGDAETVKQAIMDLSSLSARGKAAVKPTDVQIGSNQRAIEIAVAFPRSAPFTLEDKEVEFSTKLGDVTMKYKFRLKDMVYNGRLEL
jgi:hypothetical protein